MNIYNKRFERYQVITVFRSHQSPLRVYMFQKNDEEAILAKGDTRQIVFIFKGQSQREHTEYR